MGLLTNIEIEEALVTKLQTNLPNHRVEPYPDDPSKFEFTHRNGGVLIKYNSSNFGLLEGYKQSRTAEWNIVVWARSLRKADGVYELLELVRKYLCAFQPAFYQTSEGFIMHEDGIWQYGMSFRSDYYYIMGE